MALGSWTSLRQIRVVGVVCVLELEEAGCLHYTSTYARLSYHISVLAVLAVVTHV